MSNHQRDRGLYTETKIVLGLIALFLFVAVVSYVVYIPILTAVCVGLIVTALLYHFFGGIKESTFKLMTFKAGGSVAVFVFVTLFVNYELGKQLSDQNAVLGAELESGAIKVMKQEHSLGKIDSKSLFELGLFDRMEMNPNRSMQSTGKLAAGMEKNLGVYPYKIRTTKYTNSYNGFLVLDENGKLVLKEKSLRTKDFLFFKHQDKHFLIFVSAATHNDPDEKPWAIFGFTEVNPTLKLDDSSDQ